MIGKIFLYTHEVGLKIKKIIYIIVKSEVNSIFTII